MAISFGKGEELKIVLRVKDDGTPVVEKFGDTTEKTSKRSSANWGRIGKVAAVTAVAAIAASAAIVKSQVEVADAALKTAEKLGLTTEALTGLHHAATLGGIQTNTLDLALQRMTRRVAEAAQGTGEAKDALRELRLDAAQLAAMSPDQQYLAIAEAMGKIPSQSDRVRLAFKLFDSEGVAVVNTMKAGRAGIESMMQEAKELGIVIETKTARQAELFNNNLSRLGALAKGSALSFTASLLPSLIDITDQMIAAYRAGGLLEGVLAGIGSVLGIDTAKKIRILTNEIAALEQELRRLDEAPIPSILDEDGDFTGDAADALREKIEQKRKELQLLQEQINKNEEALTKSTEDLVGGVASRTLTEQQLAEIQKRYQDLRRILVGEQQALAEEFVANFNALNDARAAGLITSDEELHALRLQLAQKYEADLAAIQDGGAAAYRARLAVDLASLQQSLASAKELEIQNNLDRQLLLFEAWEQDLLTDAQFQALTEEQAKQHQERLADIELQGMSQLAQQQAAFNRARSAMWQAAWEGDLASMGGVLGEMSELMLSGSKKMFRIGKVAALAEAAISMYQAIQNALATKPFIPVGLAMAAVATARGLSNIAKIRSIEFGSSAATPTFDANPGTGLPTGAAPIGPSTGAPPATPPPPQSQDRGVTVILNGLISTDDLIDVKIVPGLRDRLDKRDQILFSSRSRQAQELSVA